MNRASVDRPAEILLIEDNQGDVRLAQEMLSETRITNHVHVVGDGEQALLFLRGEKPFLSAPRPDMILLDLNLPRVGGQEVLTEIRLDPRLRRIPVVVLTTSTSEADIEEAARQRCQRYLNKPGDLTEFTEVVKSIQELLTSIMGQSPSGTYE
jgi:CheY-like chemotaxis protein